MKKIYTLAISALISMGANAQVNWNFEDWSTITTYEQPDNWTDVNQYASILGLADVIYKKDSLNNPHGNYAIVTTTQNCPNCGSFNLSSPLTGQIGQSIAFTTTPTFMGFNYKFEPQGTDSVAIAYFQLTRWDVVGDSAITVGEYFDTLKTTNNWTVKELPFAPKNGGTPDTMNIIFYSSGGSALGGSAQGWSDAVDGTKLHVDAVYSDAMVSVKEENNTVNSFNSYVVSKNLVVKTEDIGSTVQLIDLSGKVIFTKTINNSFNQYDVSNLPSGIYLVKLTNNTGQKTNKVFIR